MKKLFPYAVSLAVILVLVFIIFILGSVVKNRNAKQSIQPENQMAAVETEVKPDMAKEVDPDTTELVCSSPAYQNEPSGFRKIPWGTSISSLKNMIYYSSGESKGEETEIYTRWGEKRFLGNIPLDVVYYHFWHGKFFYANIYVDEGGEETLTQIEVILWKRFGHDSKYYYQGSISQDVWKGDTTTIILRYNDITASNIRIDFYSTKIYAEIEEEARRKNREGIGKSAKDF